METDQEIIDAKLKEINDFLGTNIVQCDYFNKLKDFGGMKYFSVLTEKPVFCCFEIKKLQKCIDNGIIKNVEPNGVSRLAIIF